MELTGSERMIVSDWGLREGILVRLGTRRGPANSLFLQQNQAQLGAP